MLEDIQRHCADRVANPDIRLPSDPFPALLQALTRSPKVYVRDSGIAHALLGIGDLDTLLGHPVAGPSWEGFAIENLIAAAPPGTQAGFYRTSTGAEIDLVLALTADRIWAIEIKRSLAPKPERGFHQACTDLGARKRFIVHPGEERFSAGAGVEAVGLTQLMHELRLLRADNRN